VSGPELRKIEGAGDVVTLLEELAERARKGELDGIVIATIEADGLLNCTYAFKDDMSAPWSMLVAATASMQHELLTEGL
jgi:hypothetical protein